MLLSLLAAAIPLSEPQPMAEERFQQWLLESDLQQLELGCTDPLIGATGGRQQEIRDRLLVLHPAPQSFELVMANATALLTCGSPDSAARVLNRISPAVGEERFCQYGRSRYVAVFAIAPNDAVVRNVLVGLEFIAVYEDGFGYARHSVYGKLHGLYGSV